MINTERHKVNQYLCQMMGGVEILSVHQSHFTLHHLEPRKVAHTSIANFEHVAAEKNRESAAISWQAPEY